MFLSYLLSARNLSFYVYRLPRLAIFMNKLSVLQKKALLERQTPLFTYRLFINKTFAQSQITHFYGPPTSIQSTRIQSLLPIMYSQLPFIQNKGWTSNRQFGKGNKI